MKKSGFFLVSRGLFEHPRFKPRGPFSSIEAWLWLIESAAHTARDVSVDCGSTRKIIHLGRGQLTYSIRYLAKAWKWSPDRVQRFLRELAGACSVSTATSTGQSVITLYNYDKYQSPFTEASTATSTQTSTQTSTNKKELKQLERKNAHQGFDDWWVIYPRKVSKKQAERAFSKAVPALIALPSLMEKTKAFAASWKDKPRHELTYCPHPSTWLNDARYNDEPDAKPAPVVRDPRSYTDTEWKKRLDHLRDCEDWLEDKWGPRPGEPGCLVPSRLLIAPASKGAA